MDSWLDGDNNVTANTQFKGSASTTASERIYDGRSSPAKRMIHDGDGDNRLRLTQPMDSDESETEAFSARRTVTDAKTIENDDFFD